MRIALAYDLCYPFTIGGGEKRSFELARHLAMRGHVVDILTMQYWEPGSDNTVDGVHHVGICPYLPAFDSKGRRSASQPLQYALGLRRYLLRQQERYDVIECSAYPLTHLIALWLTPTALRRRILVAWFEGRGFAGWLAYQGWRGLPAACLERVIARSRWQHLTISEHARRRIILRLGISPERITCLPCGIPADWLEAPDTRNQKDIILFVGRLEPHKQPCMAVEAFAPVARQRSNTRLVLVGKGSERKRVLTLASTLNVSDRMEIQSDLSETELRTYYDRSRCLLFPSRMEGFGIAALEAMARGVPVLAFNSPDSAVPDLLSAGGGSAVATMGEMTGLLRRLFDDEAFYFKESAAARNTASRFTWQRIAQEAERLYTRSGAASCQKKS